MDPKELIAALAVLADPNASDEDKAAALDKLSGYFQSMLDSQESTPAEGASETTEPEMASEAGEDEDKEPEKDSALAKALDQVKTLSERIAKLEKASAVGNAQRAKAPTVLPRTDPVIQDPVAKMIDNALAASRRNAGK